MLKKKYFNKYYYFYLLLSAGILFVQTACDSPCEPPCDCSEFVYKKTNRHGFFSLSISREHFPENLFESYNFSGAIRPDLYTRKNYNGGNMFIAGVELKPKIEDSIYAKYSLILINESIGDSLRESIFGKETLWGVEGNDSIGIPPFMTDFYVPKQMILNYPVPNSSIHRDSILVFRWDPEETTNTTIKLTYWGVLEKEDGEPSSYFFDEIINDTGYYNTTLDSIPAKSDILIGSITRSVEEQITENGRIYNFYITSYERFVFQIIE